MKITIDLENDSVDSLNKVMELINYKITEIDNLKKLNVEKYLSYFNDDETTYKELNEKIKDKEKLDLILIHLKQLGEIFEKKKGIFARI
jgi:type I restriction-modification system DNA methylase subunit